MSLAADLRYPTNRASLTEGRVAAMHELRLSIGRAQDGYELKHQLAALGLVRQLPALAKLRVSIFMSEDTEDPVPQWPPFIPPSLKALRIGLIPDGSPENDSPLRALPGMLAASGARLERLEVTLPSSFEAIGDGLVYLAQALRCCSPTLKGFDLCTWNVKNVEGLCVPREAEDYADQMERLRMHWADLMAGVSACRELQVLVLPRIEVEPLFPRGTAFGRLTHLEISDFQREHPPAAGVVGLWELVASGGLPALAKLKTICQGTWGGVGEVRTRVAPALEAAAGTLTHLHLEKGLRGDWVNHEEDVGYELGVAVGKLRRLKDLALDLSEGGRAYHAFAQGLAASGGDRPLPLLWRVRVFSEVKTNADLLASLLLPSVRVFCSSHANERSAVIMACALRQVSYEHTWSVSSDAYRIVKAAVGAQCRVVNGRYRISQFWF
jgi:hypothetical protein